MKTIIRWTLGDVSDQGFACLRHSVRRIIDMYGSKEFEYFICYNGISNKKIDIRQKNVELLDQSQYINSLPIQPSNKFGVCWKLYPPRLDSRKREIFIDNDIILHKKIEFEHWKNGCFISEAIKRSYGSFDERIKSQVKMNSGFFGIPPGFDFGHELSERIAKFNINWDNSYFEEQGLVAHVIYSNRHFMFGMEDIGIALDNSHDFIGKYGTHFIGLNKGKDECWRQYIFKRFPLF